MQEVSHWKVNLFAGAGYDRQAAVILCDIITDRSGKNVLTLQ